MWSVDPSNTLALTRSPKLVFSCIPIAILLHDVRKNVFGLCCESNLQRHRPEYSKFQIYAWTTRKEYIWKMPGIKFNKPELYWWVIFQVCSSYNPSKIHRLDYTKHIFHTYLCSGVLRWPPLAATSAINWGSSGCEKRWVPDDLVPVTVTVYLDS